MTTYLLKINGALKNFTSLSYSEALNQVGNFSIELPEYDMGDSDIAFAHSGVPTPVQIYRDGDLDFAGNILAINPKRTKSGISTSITGRCNADKLLRLVMGKGDESSHTVGDLVRDALDGSFLDGGYDDSGITPGGTWTAWGGPEGDDPTYTIDYRMDHQDRFAYIRALADAIGWNFMVRADNTLDWARTLWPGGLTQDFEYGLNVYDTQVTNDTSQLANKIFAFGSGSSEEWRSIPVFQDGGNDVDYCYDQPSIDAYGIHDHSFTDPSIESAVLLQERAQEYLAIFKDPYKTVRLNVIGSKFEGDAIVVGNDVTMTDTDLDLDGDFFRIVRKDISVSTGGERLNIELSNKPRGLTDLITDEWSYLKKKDAPQIKKKHEVTNYAGNVRNWRSSGVTVWAPAVEEGYKTHIKVVAQDSYGPATIKYRLFWKDLGGTEHTVVEKSSVLGPNIQIVENHIIEEYHPHTSNQFWGFFTYTTSGVNYMTDVASIHVTVYGSHTH